MTLTTDLAALQTSTPAMGRAADPNYQFTSLNGSINNSTTTVVVANASAPRIVVGSRITIDHEAMYVSGVSSNTLTVSRGADGTSAASHTSGTFVLVFQPRTAGLQLMTTVRDSAWPIIGTKGGVYDAGSSKIRPLAVYPNNEFLTGGQVDLGAVSIPGDSPSTPTETASWERNTLSYSGEFDLTISRITPAVLIETTKTTVRLCGGTVDTWTVDGSVPDGSPTPAVSTPKRVAWHEGGIYHVSQIPVSPSTALDLSGMDEPWLLVWWGTNGHWWETNIPLQHRISRSYAYKADCPLLVTFGANPSTIQRNLSGGGFDLAFSGSPTAIVMLPLYGRIHQHAATTDGWNSSGNLPSGTKALIQNWHPRLHQFPKTVVETYSYDSGTDTATITETFSYVTVKSGGTQIAPLPPLLGVALDTDLGISVSTTVVDEGIPTEFGPTQAVEGAGTYDWTLTGLAAATAARPAPGSGLIPSDLRARINDEVDKLLAFDHWSPWYYGDRLPQSIPGGNVYFSNPADTLAKASELVPVVSGARQTDLIAWIEAERASFDPETVYRVDVDTGTDGNRGPLGVPNTHGPTYYDQFHPQPYHTRQWIYAAWALARYYQETGDSLSGLTLATNLYGILTDDMANQDWATSHWFADGVNVVGSNFWRNSGDRATAVENADRHWAGLAGLAWLMEQKSDTNEGLIRCLLAKATMARVAIGHLLKWQYNAGLIGLPTDLGSTGANHAWQVLTNTDGIGGAYGEVYTFDWHDGDTDPRFVTRLNQFEAFGDTSNNLDGYNVGVDHAYIGAYLYLTPPLATILDAALGDEATRFLHKYQELQPHWWVPFADAVVGGEHGQQHPTDSYGLFLARAWLDGADADTLKREAAYPWLQGGADLFGVHKLVEAARVYADADSSITGYTDNRDDYSGSHVPVWSKFEAHFQLASTVATNWHKTYHVDWRPDGLTVKGLVSSDGGSTWESERAFYEQEMDHTVIGGLDHISPTDTWHWTWRWGPSAPGTWLLKFSQEDADGVVESATQTVVVAPSDSHGPLVVSTTDTRYLEHADGTPFVLQGMNLNANRLDPNDPTVVAALLADMGANGANFIRCWLSQRGVHGTHECPWYSVRGADYRNSKFVALANGTDFDPGGYVADDTDEMAAGISTFSFVFCDWGGGEKRGFACKPDTTYLTELRYCIPTTMVGPLDGSSDYGLCVKRANSQPYGTTTVGGISVFNGVDPAYGSVVGGTHFHTATVGYVWGTCGTFTTGPSEHWLIPTSIVPDNVGAGVDYAFVSQIRIREDLGGGNYGPNIVSRPHFDLNATVDQVEWWKVDRIMEAAATAGVFINWEVLEKQDWFLERLNLTTGACDQTSISANNVFGADDSDRARYEARDRISLFMAHVGYSLANALPESYNEIAFNTPDAHATAAFGAEIEASVHARPWTASLANQLHILTGGQSTVMYHGYQITDTALDDTVGSTPMEIIPAEAFRDTFLWAYNGGAALATLAPNRPIIWSEGNTVDTADPSQLGLPNLLPLGPPDVAHILLRKLLWGFACSPTGVYYAGQWRPEVDGTLDHLDEYGHVAAFMDGLPINNGHYVDAEITVPSGLLALGQKDLTNKRAHLYLTNAEDTWGNALNSISPTPVSGDVSFDFPSGDYTLTPWDEDSDTAGSPFSVTSDGTLTWPVASLSTGVAYRIALSGGGGGSAVDAQTGSIVTDGFGTQYLAVDGFGAPSSLAVDALAGSIVTDGFGTSYLVTEGFGAAIVLEATGGSIITDGFGSQFIVTDGFGPSRGVISTGRVRLHRIGLGLGIGL